MRTFPLLYGLFHDDHLLCDLLQTLPTNKDPIFIYFQEICNIIVTYMRKKEIVPIKYIDQLDKILGLYNINTIIEMFDLFTKSIVNNTLQYMTDGINIHNEYHINLKVEINVSGQFNTSIKHLFPHNMDKIIHMPNFFGIVLERTNIEICVDIQKKIHLYDCLDDAMIQFSIMSILCVIDTDIDIDCIVFANKKKIDNIYEWEKYDYKNNEYKQIDIKKYELLIKKYSYIVIYRKNDTK